MPLRNRIDSLISSRGHSAYRFIKETGIAPATGYKLAKDRTHLPSIRVLEAICDAYEVQPNEVVVREGEEGAPSRKPKAVG